MVVKKPPKNPTSHLEAGNSIFHTNRDGARNPGKAARRKGLQSLHRAIFALAGQGHGRLPCILESLAKKWQRGRKERINGRVSPPIHNY